MAEANDEARWQFWVQSYRSDQSDDGVADALTRNLGRIYYELLAAVARSDDGLTCVVRRHASDSEKDRVWEYRAASTRLDGDALDLSMNDLDEFVAGWELAAVVPRRDGRVTCFFKKSSPASAGGARGA